MIGRALTVYPTANGWVPGGNTGEIKEARKGMATLPHKADGPGQVSYLIGTFGTHGSYMGLAFTYIRSYDIPKD